MAFPSEHSNEGWAGGAAGAEPPQPQPQPWHQPFDDQPLHAGGGGGGPGGEDVHPAFRLAFGEVDRMIRAGTVTETSWLPVVVTLMQAAAAAEKMTGLEKKAGVAELAVRLLRRIPLSADTDREAFLRFASPVVAATIEQLLEAEKGSFDLRTAGRAAMRAFVRGFDSDAVFGQLYDEVRGYVATAGSPASFRPEDLVRLVPLAMASAQRLARGKTGAQRKALVLALCYRLADEAPIADKRDKAALTLLLQMTLPSTIDALHEAASGRFDFGKAARGCLPCCFGGGAGKKNSSSSAPPPSSKK